MAAATPKAPPVPAANVEPGLENAIKWKWWVAPSDEKNWGIPLPEDLAPKQPETVPGTPGASGKASVTTVHIPSERPATYEIKKGDALYNIAKKFDMKVAQLKAFNGMTNDTIRAGQTLKIPTMEELRAMQPPPEPEKKPEETKPEEKKGKDKKKKGGDAKPEISPEVARELENLMLQIYLDREMFSAGPIDGKAGAALLKASQLYQTSHADISSGDAIKEKAKQALQGDPYTFYTLRAEDFRFIAPPKAELAKAGEKGTKSKSKASASKKDAPPPPPTYEEMVTTPFLGYQTAWEFVAERFHCDEAFLRRINHNIKTRPVAGTEFKVPKVTPFEVEKAFDAPLQPAADPDKPVTATVVEMSRLEISKGGNLIAVMPLASAHPDLRGRGTWTVLDAIPHPRMATRHEMKEMPKPKVTANLLPTGDEPQIPVATAVPLPPLDHDQYLPPGPDNPVGVMWINLAKAKSTEPLPYGLHGTSIPGQMSSERGIGGFRLANWNIARAVRLMPAGTPLMWKQK